METLDSVLVNIRFLIEDCESLNPKYKSKELSVAIANLEQAELWLEKLKSKQSE